MGWRGRKTEWIYTFIYWDRIHTDLLPTVFYTHAKAINYRFTSLGVAFLKFKFIVSVGYAVADQEDQINPGSY